MICFADTDILLKLIAFGLLRQALAALGVTSEKDVYVTPEAAYKCGRSRRERADFRQEILNAAIEFIKSVTVISNPGDLDELNALRDIDDEGIDAGEMTLLTATRGQTDFVLITGDKRALRTLTNNFLSLELHNRHLGRVHCLETIVLLLVRREGFPSVREKLMAGRYCDRVIRDALREGSATESEFIAELQRRTRELDFATQGLLKIVD